MGGKILITNAYEDGPVVNNLDTPASLLPATGAFAFLHNYMTVGRAIMVRAAGRMGVKTPTPGNLTIDLYLEGPGGSPAVIIGTSGLMALSSTAKTNVPWWMEWWFTTRTVGLTATFMVQGKMTSEALGATTVAGEAKTLLMPKTHTGVVSAVFASTVPETLDIVATWSTADAANTITLQQYIVSTLA